MQQAAPYADPEDPGAKGFEFTEQSIRKAFIRKVFSILSVSNEEPTVITRYASYQWNYFADKFVRRKLYNTFPGATSNRGWSRLFVYFSSTDTTLGSA